MFDGPDILTRKASLSKAGLITRGVASAASSTRCFAMLDVSLLHSLMLEMPQDGSTSQPSTQVPTQPTTTPSPLVQTEAGKACLLGCPIAQLGGCRTRTNLHSTTLCIKLMTSEQELGGGNVALDEAGHNTDAQYMHRARHGRSRSFE